jgi:hypothetical protein
VNEAKYVALAGGARRACIGWVPRGAWGLAAARGERRGGWTIEDVRVRQRKRCSGDEQRNLMRSRAVEQPFATYAQPLHLENTAGREALSKVGILCSFSLEQVQAMIASGAPEFS